MFRALGLNLPLRGKYLPLSPPTHVTTASERFCPRSLTRSFYERVAPSTDSGECSYGRMRKAWYARPASKTRMTSCPRLLFSTIPMYKDDPLEFISKSLHKSQIIPDVIPSAENFYPSLLFSVLYPANPERFIIGAELPRENTLDEPDIVLTPMQFPDERSRKGEVTYTLVMTDPDAPSREDPKFAQFRHWVITGLASPGPQAAAKDYKAIKTKPSTTTYYPPGPPPGTGLHRYAFLLLEEPTSEFTVPPDAPEHSSERADRRKWDAMVFAKKYGLKLVGATYFYVRGPPA